ncbi:MAG: polysulfide reductase NrfD [Candidatus Omnitrophica bacterium]|nr:polysulfide reductase NrfD [Candidatus Omnitrophota bacterium]
MEQKVKILLIFLIGIIGWAFYAYIHQIIYGLGVTAMNSPVFWGIYIVNFVFLSGISVGGIAVASLSLLTGIEKYKSIGQIGGITAIVSLILAMISILFDLGRPDRALNLIIYIHPLSPLLWDFIVLNIYLILCVLLLWSSIKNKQKLLKIFAYISIPAIFAHSVTAWIFGLIKSQPGWYNALLAPLFICSALVSGLSLIILMILFAKWALKVDIENDIIIDLGKYFKVLLPILLYLLFCEFLTISYGGIPSHTEILNEMLKGKFAIIFWFDMIVGILIPLLLSFSSTGKTIKGICLIAIFSLFGVFAERIDIVLPSFYRPLLINMPVTYFPTWVEWSLILGTYALGLLLFIIASKFVLLKSKEQKK